MPQLNKQAVSVAALSGKAKEDFEGWFVKKEQRSIDTGKTIILLFFYALTDTMKNAEIIEWFDSVEIYIHSFPRFYKIIKYDKNSCYAKIEIESKKYFKNRTLANISAIKKANKIYNTEAEH